MARVNRQPQPFNDGVLYYGEYKPINPNDVIRKKVGEEFAEVGSRFYAIHTIRDRDYLLVEALGRRVNKKVSIPITNTAIKNNHKVKIGEDVFDIVQIDNTATRQFLYLERVNRQ